MPLWRIGFVWASAFTHVIRKGPVFDHAKWNYPFGNYPSPAVAGRTPWRRGRRLQS